MKPNLNYDKWIDIAIGFKLYDYKHLTDDQAEIGQDGLCYAENVLLGCSSAPDIRYLSRLMGYRPNYYWPGLHSRSSNIGIRRHVNLEATKIRCLFACLMAALCESGDYDKLFE